MSEQNGDWWKGRFFGCLFFYEIVGTSSGKSGMIPANYLQANEHGEGGEILFPLHEAAKRGNVEWVSRIIKA